MDLFNTIVRIGLSAPRIALIKYVFLCIFIFYIFLYFLRIFICIFYIYFYIYFKGECLEVVREFMLPKRRNKGEDSLHGVIFLHSYNYTVD